MKFREKSPSTNRVARLLSFLPASSAGCRGSGSHIGRSAISWPRPWPSLSRWSLRSGVTIRRLYTHWPPRDLSLCWNAFLNHWPRAVSARYSFEVDREGRSTILQPNLTSDAEGNYYQALEVAIEDPHWSFNPINLLNVPNSFLLVMLTKFVNQYLRLHTSTLLHACVACIRFTVTRGAE